MGSITIFVYHVTDQDMNHKERVDVRERDTSSLYSSYVGLSNAYIPCPNTLHMQNDNTAAPFPFGLGYDF